MAQTLDEAFRRTSYRVRLDAGEVTLRVDELSMEIDDLLRRLNFEAGVVVTAHNPGGTATAAAENERAQARLKRAIARRGWRSFEGVNVADDGRWPDEPTLLVLPEHPDDAVALAADFGQDSVLLVAIGAPARLVRAARRRSGGA